MAKRSRPPLLVAQHPEHKVYYWDQRLCPDRQRGQFTAFFWTHNLAEQRDLDVHLRRGVVADNAIEAFSDSWPRRFPGRSRPRWRLDDGRLLAFVVDRGQPGTMTLWCSSDNGCKLAVGERASSTRTTNAPRLPRGARTSTSNSIGKTWADGASDIRRFARLGDGRLLLAWYAGTPELYEPALGTRPSRRRKPSP